MEYLKAVAMKKMRLTQATMTTSFLMAKAKSAKRGRPRRKRSTKRNRPSWRTRRSKPKSCSKLRAIRSWIWSKVSKKWWQIWQTRSDSSCYVNRFGLVFQVCHGVELSHLHGLHRLLSHRHLWSLLLRSLHQWVSYPSQGVPELPQRHPQMGSFEVRNHW